MNDELNASLSLSRQVAHRQVWRSDPRPPYRLQLSLPAEGRHRCPSNPSGSWKSLSPPAWLGNDQVCSTRRTHYRCVAISVAFSPVVCSALASHRHRCTLLFHLSSRDCPHHHIISSEPTFLLPDCTLSGAQCGFAVGGVEPAGAGIFQGGAHTRVHCKIQRLAT